MPPIFVFTMNFATIKNYLIILLALIIVVLSTCNSCKQRTIEKLKADCGKETVVYKEKVDTQILVLPQQLPISEKVRLVKEFVPRIDSFIQYEIVVDTTDLAKLKEAYFELLQDYNTRREYTDTAQFKNGTSITNSLVRQNKLIDQKTTLDSIRQEIIHEIKYRDVYKNRAQLMVGVETMWGNRFDSTSKIGGTIMLKTKSGYGFEYGRFFDFNGSQSNKVGVKKVITLRKK